MFAYPLVVFQGSGAKIPTIVGHMGSVSLNHWATGQPPEILHFELRIDPCLAKTRIFLLLIENVYFLIASFTNRLLIEHTEEGKRTYICYSS